MSQHPPAASLTVSSDLSDSDHSAGSGRYQVVARRYRPQTFAELIGQNPIAQALANALTTHRVGHAYLFTGSRGVGKTSTARIFAKSLNCVDGPTLIPCGVCDSCRCISTGEDIDVLEIDGASNRGIDDIRELRQSVSVYPSRSRFKIYIIDEVHMLTKEAFNALLKTLEEPPEHVKFIFCTTEVEKVPITIRSRCQRFDFAGIDTAAIADRLSSIAQEEQVTAEDGAFDILARRAAGSMRDAQSLLEQLLSFAPEHITLADVHGMLGTANDQLLFRLLEGVLRCDGATIFAELDAAVNDGVDLGVLMEQLLQFFRDLLVAASGGSAKLLLFCSPTQWEETKLLAEQFGLHRILASMQILDQTYSKMRYSTQGRILTELALIRLAQLEQVQMISVLLEQLKGGTPATVLTSVPQTVKPVQRALPAPPRPETPWSAPEVPVRPLPSNAAPDVHSYLGTNTKVSTPQDRLAAAAPRSVGLDDMTNEKAKQIWDEMLEEVPGMLGRCAGDYRRLRFEPPNVFWIEFAKKISKDYCETNSAQLRSLLNRVIGKAVQLRFLLVDAPEEPKKRHPETSTQRTSSAAEQGAMLRAAAKNSLVRTIEEIFGAELEDVV